MITTHKVYGDRICKNCHGLCGSGSYRRITGIRKMYFCGIRCMEEKLELHGDRNDYYESWIYNNYEFIDVKSKN